LKKPAEVETQKKWQEKLRGVLTNGIVRLCPKEGGKRDGRRKAGAFSGRPRLSLALKKRRGKLNESSNGPGTRDVA